MKFRLWHKIMLVILAFGIAIIGFMVRLPSMFSGIDTEMHSLFYFLAAAFLNILFAKRNILIHAVIFALLYAFGVVIEYAQEYSNTFFHRRIHGNADPKDITANLKGIVAFSAIWLCYIVIAFIWNTIKSEKVKNIPAPENK